MLRDAKAREGRQKIAAPQPLPGRSACRPIALWKAVVAVLSALGRRATELSTLMGVKRCLYDGSRQEQKAGDVLRCQLHPQRGPQGIEAEDLQILVEVAQPRR